jgi:AraC-like DNA-binding protein
VAREVGYENAFAFSAAFKRTHGHSPTAWRRRIKGEGPSA